MSWTELQQMGGVAFRTLRPGVTKRCPTCEVNVKIWPCVKCTADRAKAEQRAGQLTPLHVAANR